MKKTLLVSISLLAALVAQAWTVQFTNPKGWKAVSAYCFGGDGGEALGKWPGTVMTKSGDTWTLTSKGEAEPTTIIFNTTDKVSPNQTVNLPFQAGATYDMDGIEGAAKEKYTITFDNSVGKWGDVYVYTWMPEIAGAWPGTKMVKGPNNKYTFTVEMTSAPSCAGLKFHDGGTNATTNLTFDITAVYDANGIQGGETPAPDSVVEPDATAGTEDWWVNLGGTFIGDEYWTGAQPVDNVVDFGTLTTGASTFKLKIWDGKHDAYYATTGIGEPETPIEPSVATKLTYLGANEADSKEMSIDGANDDSVYKIEYNCLDKTIKVTPVDASSSSNTKADNLKNVKYYNLQGIDITDNASGICIEVSESGSRVVNK